MMNALALSLIRTYVPAAVGALLSWLLTLGVQIDPATEAALVAAGAGLLTAVYYTLARLLEQKWPGAGVLLGATKSPDSYSKGENEVHGDPVTVEEVYPIDLGKETAPASLSAPVALIDIPKIDAPKIEPPK